MRFCDGRPDYLPDDGQNDVKDGSVENYPLDWGDPAPDPDPAPACLGGCPGAAAGPDGMWPVPA